MSKRARITLRNVQALKPGETLWDTDVRGFGCRRQRADKVYFLKYRIGTRQRWLTLGTHGSPWTPEQARKKAKIVLGEVENGTDVAAIREENRRAGSVADLCARFLDEYAREHKKPSSVEADRRNINNHVGPVLGRISVKAVSRADVERLRLEIKNGKTARDEKRGKHSRVIVKGGPGAANRTVALLSKIFNWAEKIGLRPDGSNPCRHVEKFPERGRERFLSAKELSQLAQALDGAEKAFDELARLEKTLAKVRGTPKAKEVLEAYNAARRKAASPHAAAAIRLLIFTGARRDEILGLRWDQVDLERGTLDLPTSKTGKKTIHLSAPAREVFANLPEIEGNPFVICGEKEGAALVNLQKPWERVRGAAGLDDVRLHDLRHSFASIAALGASLPIVGALLGHRQVQTTARYSHFAADPLKAANEAVGKKIDAAMKARGGDVVSFDSQRKRRK